ncbi:glycosyltransferase family 2 protein [Schaalia sp. ZJ405]|uniref:glycosyltransferase family 2 protein n=1 Tax=unclassified Schaalia TaxID=2691889 RepID=UPI0013EA2F6D|nr:MULTISPECIES: glycosyltransferase family 2 protein [unclassified Schaalia]QPK80567.1 glycosyltransferase family 2 protein [Schaalia sp. ZJ405]
MTELQPLLTVVVPAYNSQDYLDRAMTTLVDYGDDVEVIIVDDGSKDNTAQLADLWAARYDMVRVIHQENKGHGGAVNAGVAQARGTYVRVVDSDDWLDRSALRALLRVLRSECQSGSLVDLVITNYVYEKVGKTHKAVVRYRNVLPVGPTIGWDEFRGCRYDQYILMHALTMRTEIVRKSGLHLPEHTFYVDYLYSYVPLPLVRTMRYLDVDLYRYFIGRDDQSVNEKVMIMRLDQLARVNRAMVEATPAKGTVPDELYRYMVHYLRINFTVCSVMAQLSGTQEHARLSAQLWENIETRSPEVAKDLEKDLLAVLVRKASPRFVRAVYTAARFVLGFN